MTTAITKTTPQPEPKPSALAMMASRISVDPVKLLATLKDTVFKNATENELLALVVVANEYDLNPFLKEIYAFPAKGGGIVPIVSVDGWNKMLIRQPDFDGIEFEFGESEGVLIYCTATIYHKKRSHPTRVTEYLAECKRNTDPWNNMPRRMLRNRTLCQASRMAFGFSGVMNDDEAATVIDIGPAAQPIEQPPKLIAVPDDKQLTPQSELEGVVISAGFSFTDLQKFGTESGNIEGADSMAGFGDIPTKTAERLLKARAGLLTSLKKIKEGQ